MTAAAVLIERGLPRLTPKRLPKHEALPGHVLIVDVCRERADGGAATLGRYLFRGPGPDERVEGWFTGAAAIQEAWSPPNGTGVVLFLDEFLRNRVYRLSYGAPRALLAGYGLAGVLASLASSWSPGRDKRSEVLHLFSFRSGVHAGSPNRNRPGIRVTPTSAGELFAWTGRMGANPSDYVTDAWGRRRQYRGRFLDLAQAAYVVTGERALTLSDACRLFELPTPTDTATSADDLVARMRVLEQLYDLIQAEFDRWPGAPYLAADGALTPSALGRAVRAAAGTPQPLRDGTGVPRRALAAAMLAAGVGARSQVRIIRERMPVCHVDGQAHYPTVSVLTQAEKLVTHEVTVRHARSQKSVAALCRLVEECTADRLLADPEVWPALRFMARVQMHGEPWTLRVEQGDEKAHTVTAPVVEGQAWVTGYDCANARRETGRTPDIVEAYTWTTGDPHPGLRPVDLLDGWTYDPTRTLEGPRVRHDLAQLLAEARMWLRDDPITSAAERQRRRGMLKVAVNAVAYGSAAQLDPQPARRHVIDTPDGPIRFDGPAERPGAYCNPAQAAFVCSAGRLLTGLLIHLVEEVGGAWAWCDTDAVTIVTGDGGGLVECRGGTILDAHANECVRALDWVEVDGILRRFSRLSHAAGLPVPAERIIRAEDGSLALQRGGRGAEASPFKLEDTALSLGDARRIDPEPAWSVSTGQKRYAIGRLSAAGDMVYDERGKPSNHGIGNLANPSPLTRRDFTIACWRHIERILAGGALAQLDDPVWLDLPEVRLYVARYPGCLHRRSGLPGEDVDVAAAFPGARPYDRFLIAGRSIGRRGAIIARYTPDPDAWLGLDWHDAHTGDPVRVTTRSVFDSDFEEAERFDPADGRRVVAVRTVRALLWRYAAPVEAFTVEPGGSECSRTTRGVIAAQPIRIVARRCTSRELGRVSERQAGLRPDEGRRAIYRDDPGLLRNALGLLPTSEADLRELGLKPRTIRYARSGRRLRADVAERIVDAAQTLVTPTKPTQQQSAAVVLAVAEGQGQIHTCRKQQCHTTVSGRQVWCPIHAQASSRTKARWRQQEAPTSAARTVGVPS